MTKFKVYGDHAGRIFDWEELGFYEVVKDTGSRIRLRWDEERGGDFDADVSPWRVDLKIDDGVISEVSYRARSGAEQARITGAELDADLARVFLGPEVDHPWDVYRVMLGQGAKFVGGRQDNDQWGRRDEIATGAGDDDVRARSGNDFLYDRGGADRYHGGSGNDMVSYGHWFWLDPAGASQGIRADLRKGVVKGPDGHKDKLVSIERLEGTHLDDTLKGDGKDNDFFGSLGEDRINGRGGFDYVRYDMDFDEGASRGIKARLDKGWVRDGFGDRDRVKNVEGVTGTDRDDSIRDGDGNNWFYGYGGDDTLKFGRGDDLGEGGAGADRFVFRGEKFGADWITDFDGEEGDRIKIQKADGRGDLDIHREDGNTIVVFGQSQVVLEDYAGEVAPYLLF